MSCYAFPRTADKLQAFEKQKQKSYIKVPQDRFWCPKHFGNKNI